MRFILFLLVVGFFTFLSCESEGRCNAENPNNPEQNKESEKAEKDLPKKENNLRQIASEICLKLANKEFKSLRNYTDKNQKLVFSPYLYIDEENIQKLTIAEFQELFNSKEKVNWGIWDGKGGQINVPAHEYYHRFIYRGDYCEEGEVLENEVKVKGNALNNIDEVFPDANFISYYLPPNENDLAEMSWKTLILIFDENKNIVGIVNHEWTI